MPAHRLGLGPLSRPVKEPYRTLANKGCLGLLHLFDVLSFIHHAISGTQLQLSYMLYIIPHLSILQHEFLFKHSI